MHHLQEEEVKKEAAMVALNEKKNIDCQTSLDLGYHSSSFLSTSSTTTSSQSIQDSNVSSVVSSEGSCPRNEKNEWTCDSGLDIQDCFSNLSLSLDSSSELSYKQPSSLPRNIKDIWLDAFVQDQDGDTHLHLAIIQGYVDAVYALIPLAPHPKYLDIQNDLSQSPLHLAVLTRQPAIVRRLVVAGANVHSRDRLGNTPLYVACEQGDLDTVRQLTIPVTSPEAGPSALKQRVSGHGQLRWRGTASNLEARNYEGLRCVHIAAVKGHREVLRHLVAYGANVNAQEDRSGRTALHLSVETQNLHLVEFLVRECGADVNALTYSGHSAFHLAVGSNTQMTNLLVQLGALVPQEPLATSDSSESDSDNMDSSDYDGPQVNGNPFWP